MTEATRTKHPNSINIPFQSMIGGRGINLPHSQLILWPCLW